MTLHMAVVVLAAPLVACGVAPRLPMGVRASLALPAWAGLADLVVIWLWHTPGLHRAARTQTAVFVVEQVSFLLVGTALWVAALAATSGGSAPSGRGNPLAGAAALFFTGMHMTLLGVLLALARVPVLTVATKEALADQQRGGVIMLAVGGVVYLTGGIVLVARELAWAPARPVAQQVGSPDEGGGEGR